MKPSSLLRSAPLAGLLSVALVAVIAGCGSPTTSPAQWAADLGRARTLWNTAGYTNYTYSLLRFCNCTADQTRPVKITVVHGVLNRIVFTDSIGGYADTTLWRQYLTMDRYFQQIDAILTSGPSNFTATYSPTLGIPTFIDVNPDKNIVDDEFSVQTLSFVRDSL